MSRRQDKSDEGCREQHLDDGNVTIITAEDSRERICVVDTKAFGCADSKTAVVLIKGDEIKRWTGHGEIEVLAVKLVCSKTVAV
jgi:hypothetical protein